MRGKGGGGSVIVSTTKFKITLSLLLLLLAVAKHAFVTAFAAVFTATWRRTGQVSVFSFCASAQGQPGLAPPFGNGVKKQGRTAVMSPLLC